MAVSTNLGSFCGRLYNKSSNSLIVGNYLITDVYNNAVVTTTRLANTRTATFWIVCFLNPLVGAYQYRLGPLTVERLLADDMEWESFRVLRAVTGMSRAHEGLDMRFPTLAQQVLSRKSCALSPGCVML